MEDPVMVTAEDVESAFLTHFMHPNHWPSRALCGREGPITPPKIWHSPSDITCPDCRDIFEGKHPA